MDKEKRKNGIRKMCEKVRMFYESERNKTKLSRWESIAGLQNVFTRWIPKTATNTVSFIADLDREMWVQVLDMDIEEIYSDPLAYLEFELRKKIYAFENLNDDFPLTKIITIWHGVGFLQTLLGLEQEPAQNGHEPWVGKHSIIKDRNNLESLKIPDFYSSGLMPKIHTMYKTIRETLDDDFGVVFPEWDFGCYGIALSLRGTGNFSIDLINDTEFAHALLQFIFKSKSAYSKERATFLNTELQPLYIPNDDINVPLISPQVYRDFILPYEIKTSELHGGIDYWHSCGRVDPLLEHIKKIPDLKMIHISYANDFQVAAEAIGSDHIIEYVLNPIDDVLKASPEQMATHLKELKALNEGLRYTVRADAFQVLTNIREDLNKINLWIRQCRKLFGG